MPRNFGAFFIKNNRKFIDFNLQTALKTTNYKLQQHNERRN